MYNPFLFGLKHKNFLAKIYTILCISWVLVLLLAIVVGVLGGLYSGANWGTIVGVVLIFILFLFLPPILPLVYLENRSRLKERIRLEEQKKLEEERIRLEEQKKLEEERIRLEEQEMETIPDLFEQRRKAIESEGLEEERRFEEEQQRKGLSKFVDRYGSERWGKPEEIEIWKKEDNEARIEQARIEQLKMVVERIKKNRPLYEQNEMAVRQQIINPILRNLGWDPENPEEVQPNISTEEGIPDYSLIKNGKKMLFVEAKNLGTDIEEVETLRQLAMYCFGEGKKYGILTNGSMWILVRSFEEGTTLKERVTLRIDLESEEIHIAFKKLSTISKDNVERIEELVGCIEILGSTNIADLAKSPERYENKTIVLRGYVPLFYVCTDIGGFSAPFRLEEFKYYWIKDEQGYNFLIKPMQESGRDLFLTGKDIEIKGIVKHYNICVYQRKFVWPDGSGDDWNDIETKIVKDAIEKIDKNSFGTTYYRIKPDSFGKVYYLEAMEPVKIIP